MPPDEAWYTVQIRTKSSILTANYITTEPPMQPPIDAFEIPPSSKSLQISMNILFRIFWMTWKD